MKPNASMAFQEELSAYADRSSDLLDESPQMDEENTKRKIIEPLIDLLGWEILSSDVELEYSVQMGSGTKKVDYALKLDGTPVVFVEAKGSDTSLNQGHEDQLRSYMRQVGVDWGLLSNGRTFEIFQRDVSSNQPNEISLAAFPLEDVPKNEQPLRTLSSSSIRSGESQRIAETLEAVQRAVASLRENKEPLAEDVTAAVTEVTGNSVSQQVEDEAKSFVDNLIESLEKQAHHKRVVDRPLSGSVQDEGETDDSQYVIRVVRNGAEVHRISEAVQSKAVASLVDYLIEEQGLLDEIEVPYIPGTGQGSRALLNDEPKHPDGSPMKRKRPVSSGHYLHTNLSSDDKIRYVSELTDRLGLECEFAGGW